MKYLPDVSRIFSDDKSGCLINELSQRFFPCETSDYIHLFTKNINFQKTLSSENNKTEAIFCDAYADARYSNIIFLDNGSHIEQFKTEIYKISNNETWKISDNDKSYYKINIYPDEAFLSFYLTDDIFNELANSIDKKGNKNLNIVISLNRLSLVHGFYFDGEYDMWMSAFKIGDIFPPKTFGYLKSFTSVENEIPKSFTYGNQFKEIEDDFVPYYYNFNIQINSNPLKTGPLFNDEALQT